MVQYDQAKVSDLVTRFKGLLVRFICLQAYHVLIYTWFYVIENLNFVQTFKLGIV